MFCTKCKNADTKVIDSRVMDDWRSIKRRRECERCGHRFTTFERLEFVKFMVVKNDGTKEIYDRDKLEKSILMACNKRNIDIVQIEDILQDLENAWWANKTWVTAKRIWKDVIQALYNLDKVAYVRYASVYYSFDSMEDFTSFITWEEFEK